MSWVVIRPLPQTETSDVEKESVASSTGLEPAAEWLSSGLNTPARREDWTAQQSIAPRDPAAA